MKMRKEFLEYLKIKLGCTVEQCEEAWEIANKIMKGKSKFTTEVFARDYLMNHPYALTLVEKYKKEHENEQ